MNESRDDLAEGIGLLRGLISPKIGGDAKIELHINAGGVGVWIAATCCLITLSAVLVGGLVSGLWLVREFNRVDIALSERKEENDKNDTYLSGIWGRLPELRKQIDEDAKREKELSNAQHRSDHP